MNATHSDRRRLTEARCEEPRSVHERDMPTYVPGVRRSARSE
jgi:hypothetical protein